jgi:hypothetical protein
MGGNKETEKKDKESTKQEEDQKEGTATPSRKALKAAYVKLKNLTLKIGVCLLCARVRTRDSQTSFRLTHAQKPDTLKIRLSPCIPMSLSMHASQLYFYFDPSLNLSSHIFIFLLVYFKITCARTNGKHERTHEYTRMHPPTQASGSSKYQESIAC